MATRTAVAMAPGTRRVAVGKADDFTHAVVYEDHLGGVRPDECVGGFIEYESGKPVGFDFASGTFTNTELRPAAKELLNKLLGK